MKLVGLEHLVLSKDVEALRKKGLVMGGSINNAVVLDEFKIINQRSKIRR